MQHHGRVPIAVLADIGGAEPARHVEVYLQRAALPIAADRVAQHELDLRAIERAFAAVIGERQPERAHRVLERALRFVPHLVAADAFRRAIGELHDDVVEAEVAVDVEQQPAYMAGLGGDLVFGAEDVSIVLRESAHAHQAVQSARRLEAMYFAELRYAIRQVSVATQIVFEHLDVTGAVHRLHDQRVLVARLAREHVLAERVPVPRGFPQRS